jgi:hypothetical protein
MVVQAGFLVPQGMPVDHAKILTSAGNLTGGEIKAWGWN